MTKLTKQKPAPDHEPSESDLESAELDMMNLIPDLFDKFFEFFRPGHTQGVVPARIKELARLKIAALNDCDT